MKTRDSLNEMSYEEYKNLWRKFWFHKLGYYPSKTIEKIVAKYSIEEARKRDDKLEKEFLKFYNSIK